MAKTYRAAAIGDTGRGGYGHGLHLPYRDMENVEFAALADPDEAGRRVAQAETAALRTYADYEQMLKSEEPDIVSVCPRWTDRHRELILACLDAGCHIYSEKPMTWNLEDGDVIVASAREKGLKIAVAHQAVYLPQVQQAKALLEKGLIGKVLAFYAHGKQDTRGGGEDMIVLGTHLFNIMRYIAGDVSWMSGHVTVGGRELRAGDVREAAEPVGPIAGDCINSYYAFASGVSGFFDSHRYEEKPPAKRFGMEIVGSDGILSFRNGSGENMMVYPHPVLDPAEASQKWEPLAVEDLPLQNGNQLAIVDLIDAIENDRKPISADTDAVAALEMILGAYESQLTGRRVEMPMVNRTHPLVALVAS